MPLRTALKRCPDAVFLPVDAPVYLEASRRVMDALRSFGFVVQVMGWDEAFIAVETDDPKRLAREIQRRVLERTELWCSIGIGDNKLQAKIATDAGRSRRGLHVDPPIGGPSGWGRGRRTRSGGSARRRRGSSRRSASARWTSSRRPTSTSWEPRSGPSTGPWLARLARGGGHEPGRRLRPGSRGREPRADLPGGPGHARRRAPRARPDRSRNGGRRSGRTDGRPRAWS